ncbi:hypothetical protein NXV10_17495 [Bacteroides thetaiotaomicron]|nr:hypothetical protein [Bacteroides thetaiotaomicron]
MEQLFKAIQAIAEANPDGFTVDLTTLKRSQKAFQLPISKPKTVLEKKD